MGIRWIFLGAILLAGCGENDAARVDAGSRAKVGAVCDLVAWYADSDGDGRGNGLDRVFSTSCKVSGRVVVRGDCDDSDPLVYRGAREVCDGVDNDCDGLVDGDDKPLFGRRRLNHYADLDGDGFGDPGSLRRACRRPLDHVSDDSDCDDSDAAVNPDATEVCNEIDDDCDGDIDDEDTSLDVSTGSTWYADVDGDDHGDPGTGTVSCEELSGYTLDASDCDDADSTIHPDVEEGCPDEVDNDCDGTVDEADTDTVTVVVEGVDSDLDVCVPCSSGDYSCQAQHLCDDLTGETCEYQTYECIYGTEGSWYPPTYGGGSNFNFAYTYDLVSIGTVFGNICDGSGVANSFGIATNYASGMTGYWKRK